MNSWNQFDGGMFRCGRSGDIAPDRSNVAFSIGDGDKIGSVVGGGNDTIDVLGIMWESKGQPKAVLRIRNLVTDNVEVVGVAPKWFHEVILEACNFLGVKVTLQRFGRKAGRWWQSLIAESMKQGGKQ